MTANTSEQTLQVKYGVKNIPRYLEKKLAKIFAYNRDYFFS